MIGAPARIAVDDEAAASETPQAVAILEGLAGPLDAFREDQHQLVALEQSARVVGMADRLPGSPKEPAEDRHAHEEAGHQRPHVARLRVLDEHRRLDHRAVPRQHAGVVGDQQGTTSRRHVLDAGGLDAPVVAIQDLEHGEERFGPLRVEAEVVDLVGGAALSELALLVGELNKLHHAVEVDDLVAGRLA